MGLPDRLTYILYLREHLDWLLTGQRASLELDDASIRIRGHTGATLDERRVDRRTAEQWVSLPWQHISIEPMQLGEQESRMADGIDTELVPAAVRRAPRHLHFDPHEAAMRGHDGELRRLGDHAGGGPDPARNHPPFPHACLFLAAPA